MKTSSSTTTATTTDILSFDDFRQNIIKFLYLNLSNEIFENLKKLYTNSDGNILKKDFPDILHMITRFH